MSNSVRAGIALSCRLDSGCADTMSHPRLAVFDVDGTLVDSERNIVAAMEAAWASVGLGAPRPEAVRRIIGLSLGEACAALLPLAPPATHRAMADAFVDAFRDLRQRPDTLEPLFPGVAGALDRLEDAGWLLGIATGKSRRGVGSVLDGHGLAGRFVTVQTADDNPGKPNPTMLLRAAAEAGAEPAATVMIGDTAYDMAMAGAAGTLAVGVAWGYHGIDELRSAGATAVIDSFDDLGDILTDLTRAPPCG